MQSGEGFSGEDDVALLTCEEGDCPLQENSFIDSNQWPRATVNDKPLLVEFPYLAEPWPYMPQAPGAWSPCRSIFQLLGMAILAAIVLTLVAGPFLPLTKTRLNKSRLSRGEPKEAAVRGTGRPNAAKR